MSILASLAKHGISAIVGFVLGLVAIAVIEPVTTNGKILLLLTVICICVVLGALFAIVTRGRWPRGDSGKE
jgi:uncharacterized membrane protein